MTMLPAVFREGCTIRQHHSSWWIVKEIVHCSEQKSTHGNPVPEIKTV
uniref:Uncharacterized protein n=1 Tax=Rhizophora mucronata TaxID=61149 RepID=A0A2P2PG66_RHIMU